MKFREEVRSFIKKVEQFILEDGNSVKLIELLEKENTSLREQNELLFNKLMARNFEEYAVYKTEGNEFHPPEKIDPLADETLAGDIVDEVE